MKVTPGVLLLIILACGIFFSSPMHAQKKEKSAVGEAIEGGEDQVKLFKARQAFLGDDFKTALNLYKEVLQNRPNDAAVIFRIGEVYLAMELTDDAIENLEKARQINPNAHEELMFNLGKAYQMNGTIDSALIALNTYRKSVELSPKKIEESRVDYYIRQCNTAKEMMAKPVDVTVTNMGDMINSTYDDKAPALTADGKTFLFTSRRPVDKKSTVDKEGDFKYFEDVYISYWDEEKNNWGEAEPIKGSVNTEGHDACTSVSPDGKMIFLYKNNPNEGRGGEIFISKLTSSGKWGAPKTIGKPINTSYFEGGACISADGGTLFFFSERPGGYGQSDIWMSKKISRTEWGKPVNLGPEVNTPDDEGAIFLHPDGKTLFFSSNGHNSMGSYDIFMTVYENGRWSKPLNLGYPINSMRKDVGFVLSTDNKTAYFASDRNGGLGERDIYRVDMSRYPLREEDKKQLEKKGPQLSILKGTVLNAEAAQYIETEVVILDKETGQKVASTYTNTEGEYFFTLVGRKSYVIEVDAKGFNKVSEPIFLPADDNSTHTEVKHIVLTKK